jgi:hypothetical protein
MKRESKNAAALRQAASAAGVQISADATAEIARINEASAAVAPVPALAPTPPPPPPAAAVEEPPAPETPTPATPAPATPKAPEPEVPASETPAVSAEPTIVDHQPIDESRFPEEDQFSVSVYRKDIAAMEEIKAILRANGYLTVGNSQAIRIALRALTKSPKLVVSTYAKMLPEDKRRKAEPKKKRA